MNYVLIFLGFIVAVFCLAQGLMVRHPTAPLWLLFGAGGLTLVVVGIIRAARKK